MNGDGKPDLVSVRMNVYQPFSNDGRVTLWLNHWGEKAAQAGPGRRPGAFDIPDLLAWAGGRRR